MDFSVVVARELAAFVNSAPSQPAPAAFEWGGSWRCPADGSAMVEYEGAVVCASCSRTLPNTVLYQRIEFHYHPR